MANESLELTAVRKRFTESAEALDQLRERLRALALAEETSSRSAASLQSCAEQNERLAAELVELTANLGEATAVAASTLAAAESFVASADLSTIATQLSTIASDLKAQVAEASRGIQDQVTEEAQRVGHRLDALEARVGNVASAQAEAVAAKTQLDDLRRVIPARTRNKLGIPPAGQ